MSEITDEVLLTEEEQDKGQFHITIGKQVSTAEGYVYVYRGWVDRKNGSREHYFSPVSQGSEARMYWGDYHAVKLPTLKKRFPDLRVWR
jgi:hypothetical protein